MPGMGIAELSIVVLMVILVVGVYVYPILRILQRIGYNKYLALWLIIPIGLPILLYMIAFGKWKAREVIVS